MSEVNKIENKTELSVTITTTLSDESTSTGEFKVGEGVQKLVYLNKGVDGVISGTITGIKYRLQRNNQAMIESFIIADNDTGKEVEIPVELIKLCGSPETKVEEGQDIATVLDSIEEGQVINVPVTEEGATVSPVQFTKSAMIKGAQAQVSAISEERANDSVEGETVVGAVSAVETAEVNLLGVAVTGTVDLSKSKDATMRNCKMVNIVPTAKKTQVVLLGGTDPIKLEVKDCYFGKASTDETNPSNNLYNYFEMNRPLSDGTIFENLKFEKDACTHNPINIYNVEDGATITIRNCEFGKYTIRIGTFGNAHCTINIENCTFHDTGDDYTDLFCIQPYSSKTTDMSHVTVNVTNPINKSGKKDIYHMYPSKGMPYTEYNIPTIIIDGKVVQKAKVQK